MVRLPASSIPLGTMARMASNVGTSRNSRSSLPSKERAMLTTDRDTHAIKDRMAKQKLPT